MQRKKVLPLFSILASLTACGQFSALPHSHLQGAATELLDTDPIKLHCWAMSKKSPEPVEVDYDDQADIRVCVALQNDGHLGIDLRYRPDSLKARGAFAQFKVQNAAGVQASELFPLTPQKFSSTFEIYLGDGCVIGGVQSCVKEGSAQMRQLFRPLQPEGDGSSYAPFTLQISLLEVKTEKTLTSHPAFRQSYRINVPAL